MPAYTRPAAVLLGCAALTISLAACTARPVRPASGVALVHAIGIDGGHGLLVFHREAHGDEPARSFVAKHSDGGSPRWVRELGPSRQLSPWEPVQVVGRSGLLPLLLGDAQLLRVDLDNGEMRTWTRAQEGSQAEVWATVGDERQVFVFWLGRAGVPGTPHRIEIAAFDQQTGERSWTMDRELATDDRSEVQIRLDPAWMLIGEPDRDVQLIRRDGGQTAAIVADAPGLCRAAGQWWMRRDDHLLAVDLGGDQPRERSAEAGFIAAARRQQWSLNHCAESGDEALLLVDGGPGGGGAVVGVDPVTSATRWTMPLPHPATPAADAERVGRVAMVRQAGHPCAVDLAQRRVLWCAQDLWSLGLADGEDTVLVEQDLRGGMRFARVGGADGTIQAAVDVVGGQWFDPSEDAPALRLRGGRIWLASREDPEVERTDRLPHVVLDARDLRPIERPASADGPASDPTLTVRDVMHALDEHVRRNPEPERVPPYDVEVPVNPLDAWAFADPSPAGPREPAEAQQHLQERVFAAGREHAKLSPDVTVRPLAWRDLTVKFHDDVDEEGPPGTRSGPRHEVVGFVELRRGDSVSYVLIRGEAHVVEPFVRVSTRAFARRPRASDVYRFVLDGLVTWPIGAVTEQPVARRGTIDEDAWRDLTGVPRDQRWFLGWRWLSR